MSRSPARFERALAAPALLLALLAFPGLAARTAAEPLLRAPFTAVAVGSPLQYVAVADLDGDGVPDLVGTSQSTGAVHVARGLGDGRFASPLVYAPSPGGSRPAIADLTGDGVPDIAIADFPNSSVFVLPGLGDGTFGAAFAVSIGFQCYTVATTDLNGDGLADLVASNWTSVAVRLATGGGAFASATSYETATNTYRIAVGDVNDDGHPDVVTAGDYGTVSVLPGTGTGTLLPYQGLGVGTGVTDLSVRDVDDDGRDDVVVGVTNGIEIFPSAPGGFGQRRVLQVPGTSGVHALLDLDGDGYEDVVVIADNYGSRNSAYVLFGDDAGSFAVPTPVPSLYGQVAVSGGDLDGDGRLDFVVSSVDGLTALHLGSAGRTFGSSRQYPTGADPIAVGIGDLDGDGVPDLVAAHHQSWSVSVRRGFGDGTFGVRRDFASGGLPPQAMLVGDVDGDGRDDLLVGNAADNGSVPAFVTVMRAYDGDDFGSTTAFPAGQGVSGLAFGDLNEDGSPDVVVADRAANRASVILNAGDGTFLPPVLYGAGNGATGVAVGDLDGDDHLDVAVANRDGGSLSLLFGDGHGGFSRESLLPVAPDCRSVAIGRLPGDAIPDLVTANGENGTVAVLEGLGGGSFELPTILEVGGLPSSVAIARMDSDSLADVVLGMGDLSTGAYTGPVNNTIGVLLGRASGGFQSALRFGAGRNPQSLAIGDLDRNGSPDLVAAARSDELLTILASPRSTVGVAPPEPLAAIELGRGYPNPAIQGIWIPFTLPRAAATSVRIFDAAGRLVRTVVDGVRPGGTHLERWDRLTDSGETAAAGLYFYELRALDRRVSGRIVLL